MRHVDFAILSYWRPVSGCHGDAVVVSTICTAPWEIGAGDEKWLKRCANETTVTVFGHSSQADAPGGGMRSPYFVSGWECWRE